jgi:hypothetical protein
MCHDINCLQRIRRAWMPINKAYLLFLKRSKYQRDKERAMRNLVRFEGLGANSQEDIRDIPGVCLPQPGRDGDATGRARARCPSPGLLGSLERRGLCRLRWQARLPRQTAHPSLSSPASVVLVKALVERKRSRRFADDDRLIGDYKIKDVNGEPRLWAEARSPYSKEQAGQTG